MSSQEWGRMASCRLDKPAFDRRQERLSLEFGHLVIGSVPSLTLGAGTQSSPERQRGDSSNRHSGCVGQTLLASVLRVHTSVNARAGPCPANIEVRRTLSSFCS